jgi:EmrB/QacA subfamily drug resistance transporter
MKRKPGDLSALPGRSLGRLGGTAPTVLAVLCIAPFVAVLDTTIMNIALPSIRDDLGFRPTAIQWVLTAYSLSFGGLLVLGGRLGDVKGRKRVLVAGYAFLGVASLIGGLATSPGWLVAARIFQGAASAALVPCSLSLLTATYTDERDRNRALAAFGAMVGVGFVTAMLLGGVLTTWLGWRSVLLVNVPISFVALAAALLLVDESTDPNASGHLDVVGAVTVTTGFGAIIYALSEVSRLGWTSPLVLSGLIGGGVLLVVFVRHELTTAEALLPPVLLRRLEASSAYLVAGCRSLFGIGVVFVLTLFMQDVRSLSPFQTGLLFTPMAVTSILVAPIAGRLTTRWGIRNTVIAGVLTMLSGMVLTLQMSESGTLAVIVAGMVVSETGFMLSEIPTTLAAAGALGRDRSGLAAGLLGTSQQLGHAVGLAAIATVMGIVVSGAGDETAVLDGLRWGVLVAGAGAICALLTTLKWLPARVVDEDPAG